MDATKDTIVAIATPPGRGGIAVVRLSGNAALRVARALAEERVTLEPRRATLATLLLAGEDEGEAVRDQAILTAFPGPASYTGEDVVEVSVHGGALIAARVVAAAVRAGARVARPGEFTLRAFLSGRLDLAQAEAVRDLVEATTPLQARMAFDQLHGTLSERIGAIERDLFELSARLEASVDFPEEGYHFVQPGEAAEALAAITRKIDALLAESGRGRLVREGATVALAGRTNVGKSTVFNRLAGADRAIVTEIPGTTRDLLTERLSIGGVPVMLVDTAGMRGATDPVEREGVARAERARQTADLVVVVLDRSSNLEDEDRRLLRETGRERRVLVANKVDLPPAWDSAVIPVAAGEGVLAVSAVDGTGIEKLADAIGSALGNEASPRVPPAVSSLRHVELLRRARDVLVAVFEREDYRIGRMPEEFLLSELQAARDTLEEITGKRASEELLDEVFSRFCVGK